MRTTLDLDDRVVLEAKKRALDRGETLTQFVEGAIRSQLAEPARKEPFRLKLLIKKGPVRKDVDWGDRDALYTLMEEEP